MGHRVLGAFIYIESPSPRSRPVGTQKVKHSAPDYSLLIRLRPLTRGSILRFKPGQLPGRTTLAPGLPLPEPERRGDLAAAAFRSRGPSARMGSGHTRHRHHRDHGSGPRAKLWIGFGIIVALGLLSVFALIAPPSQTGQVAGSFWRSAEHAFGKSSYPAATHAVEKVYPYSIIAGGVHNKQQFEEAMRTDPVAAAHYADFNAAKFHIVKLQHAEAEYVSFRVGDNVYWTSHKVLLRKGSELISDGTHLGRTRCGNRISRTPRLPNYNHEPSARELNTPVVPAVATKAFYAAAPMIPGVSRPVGSIPNAPLPPGPGPTELASSSPSGYTPFTGTPLYPAPPVGCPSGTDSIGGRCSTVRNKPPHDTPNAPTPEDSTWVLFLTGGAVLVAAAIRRKRSHASLEAQ